MNRMMLTAALAAAVGVANAESPEGYSVCDYRMQTTVPLAAKADVTVDGRAEEPLWAVAPRVTRLVSAGTYSPEGADTQVRLAADGEALYLFAEFSRIASSTIAKTDYPRDKMLPTDTLELFLKPSDEDRQYHFMVDSRGNVNDASFTYRLRETKEGEGVWNRVKRDLDWTAEGLVVKTQDNGKDGWTLEMKLPWKDLGRTPPKAGESIRANFCRGDYCGAMHNQITSWTLQKSAFFAMWPDWGTVAFADEPVRVRGAEVLKGGESVTVDLVGGAKDASVKVVVEEMSESGDLKPIGEATENLPAGAEKTLPVALREQTVLSWISVFVDGQLVYRRGGRPAGRMLMIGLYDPLNIRNGRIFIPNDASWYTPFRITHTLTGKSGNKVYGNPPDVDARIVAEVPEGVTVTKIKYSDWGGDAPIQKVLSDETFTEEGRTWHRITLPAYISGVNKPLVFFRSTLPADTVGKYRLYMTWKDGRQKPVEHDFRVVSYGRVKPFERMQMRLDDMTFNLADAVCDGQPLATELPRLGVNVFKIPLFPSKIDSPRYGKKSYKDRLDEFVASVRASGLTWYFASMNDLNGLMAWTTEKAHSNWFNLKPDPEACLVDCKGERQRTQFQWWAICPNYRGRNFTDFAKGILSTEAVKDYGVSWAVIDWEFWDLERPCCCDRCLEIWRSWSAERALPDFGDPREFLKSKEETEAVRQYLAFFDWSIGRLYVDLKREVSHGLDLNRTKWYAPKKGAFVLSDWISPRQGTLEGMDFHDCPWAYRAPWDPSGAMRHDRLFREVTKGRSDQIVCSLNAMQGCEINREFPPVATYYNVLEAAAAGHQGFEWWYVPSFDAETWKYVMDGLKAIRPFEDIILDGQVSLTGTGNGCTWRRVTLNDEAIYLVRNYDLLNSGETKNVVFTVDELFTGEVRDGATGENLADLGPGANKVKLTLGPDHLARLLYVGRKYDLRMNAVQ